MKWSWRIGRVAGIDVYMHATFLLLIAWVGLSHWMREQSLGAATEGVAFILALFGCVLLHELGHALTARRYGIRSRDITLLPIGGVARLERMPEEPRQELWVALAGPAVNVVIAIAIFAFLQVTGGLVPLAFLSVGSGSFLERLMVVNAFLAAFNLVPAFPMDGGRVVRAVLATRMEYPQATQVAAMLGQAMAFLFGLLGLFSNPFLLFIAFFVYIGAAQESHMVQMRHALGGIPVRQAMITHFRTLGPEDALSQAVEMVLDGSQQDFPVVTNDQVVGVLTRTDLLAALARRGQGWWVMDAMRRDIQLADASEMLEGAFVRLQACECHTLPVLHEGRLAGLLTMENVGEFLAIQSALGAAKTRGWS